MNATDTTQFAALYAAELAHLAEIGATDIRIEHMGGGDTAIMATIAGHQLVAGNMQPGLYTAAELAELRADGDTPEWSAGLYRDDDFAAEGLSTEGFAAAVHAALEDAADAE